MRRRDVLAGIASAGVLTTGGYLAVRGTPSPSRYLDEGSSEKPERMAVETVAATGSEEGEVLVPAPDRATFLDFFATWCQPCIQQMPALREAHERVGDDILFLSVTNESIPDSELAAWWDEHDGAWTIGLDPALELAERYSFSGYPTAVAVSADGEVRWSEDGVKTADELVSGIERAIEA